MSLMPTAPRSIGGVLDDAIRLYRAALPKCMPLILVASVILLIPGLILASRMQGLIVSDPAAMLSLLRSPAIWLTYLAIIVVGIAAYNALIIHIDAIARGESAKLGASFRAGLKRVPAMFVTGFLFMLIVSIGFVLLIIPGFYVWGIFQLAFVPLLLENAGVFESFGISRRLIKGNWWRTTTIITVAFIILYVLMLVVGIAAGLMAGFRNPTAGTNMIAQQIMSSVLNILIMPFLPAVMLAVYYDLKLRNEGTDLEERVAALNPAS